MALHLLKSAGYINSIKVEDGMVILKNELKTDAVVTLSFKAFDEMVEYVKKERKEALPTFEDVRGIFCNKKGENDGR